MCAIVAAARIWPCRNPAASGGSHRFEESPPMSSKENAAIHQLLALLDAVMTQQEIRA